MGVSHPVGRGIGSSAPGPSMSDADLLIKHDHLRNKGGERNVALFVHETKLWPVIEVGERSLIFGSLGAFGRRPH